MSELVQRNVVLVPDQLVGDVAISWSKLLSEVGAEFVLGEENLAHVSMYQAAYPPDVMTEISNGLEKISNETSPFSVVADGLGTFWETFLFWDMVKSADLTVLHQRCLRELNPLRQGRLTPIQQQLLTDSSVARYAENIRKYGHPLCDEEELPHMTLSRLKDPKSLAKALRMLESQRQDMEGQTFKIDRLFLAEVGPHGTCPRLLEEFPFSG